MENKSIYSWSTDFQVDLKAEEDVKRIALRTRI